MFKLFRKILKIDKLVAEEVDRRITELKRIQKMRSKREYSILDSIVVQPNVEYELFVHNRPVAFWGLLDLAELKHGDSIEVSVFLSLDSSKPKLNHKRTFHGPLDEPVIDFPERFAEAVRVTAKMLTGQPREITYHWYWR